jgi:hypothetical protein
VVDFGGERGKHSPKPATEFPAHLTARRIDVFRAAIRTSVELLRIDDGESKRITMPRYVLGKSSIHNSPRRREMASECKTMSLMLTTAAAELGSCTSDVHRQTGHYGQATVVAVLGINLVTGQEEV